MEKQFCPNCEASRSVKVLRREETLRVRETAVVYEAVVSLCPKCGETFATEAQEGKNVERAYAEYRRKEDILSPADIQGLRGTYGLSQLNMSRWLGWGDITFHRYESGSLPDAAHNSTLVLLKDARNAKKLVTANKRNLSEPVLGQLQGRIDALLRKDGAELLREDLESTLNAIEPNELNGFRRFDIDRFEQLALYVLSRFGPCFKTGLNKLLWYIDFGCYQEQASSITGSQYLKFQHGPIPRGYDYLFAGMIEKGLVSMEEVAYKETVGERYSAAVEPKKSLFFPGELDLADRWIKRLKGLSSKQLSDFAHKEKGYLETKDKTPIAYRYAMELKVRAADKKRD